MQSAIAADGRLADLQFWKLVVLDCKGKLTMSADKEVCPAIFKEIEFTDFPLEKVRIWAGFNGERWTLYLPSEH